MGRIITTASSKGGCSKSAIVMILSANLAACGYRVAVIDADPNACYDQWHRLYEGPPIDCSREIRQEEIVDHAQARAREFEVVLIDTAGFGNTTAAFAAGTADMVLIPVMPDRASAVEAMRTARQVQAFGKAGNRQIPFRVVRSRWNPRGHWWSAPSSATWRRRACRCWASISATCPISASSRCPGRCPCRESWDRRRAR